MKRIIFLTLCAALISAVSLTSCNNDDGYSLSEFRVSLGTIVAGQGRSFTILLDNGSELVIVANMIPRAMVSDGERVIVNFTILGSDENVPDRSLIRLNGLQRVLSKPLILQSFIDEDAEVREDSIGHAPISVRETFFGGGFINITGIFASTGWPHMLNLVYDDTQDPTAPARLTLRHSEPDARRLRWVSFIASFPLAEVIVPPATEREIEFSWTDYDNQVYTRTGTFRLNVNDPAPATFFDDGGDPYEEPI